MGETDQGGGLLRPERVGPGQARQLAGAMALLNRELGDGMYSLPRLQEVAAGPASAPHVCRDQAEVVAASVTRLLAPADVDYYLRFGAAAESLFARHRIGSLEALAVEPSHRRRGLGRALVAERLSWIAAQGYDAAAGLAWVSGRPDNSEVLYRGLGFRFGPTVGEFYLEESIREGWACPVCGGPCRCAATFFYKLFS